MMQAGGASAIMALLIHGHGHGTPQHSLEGTLCHGWFSGMADTREKSRQYVLFVTHWVMVEGGSQ